MANLNEFEDINNIKEFIKSIEVPLIPDSTNFWMIRTKGGSFFDEFIAKGFIALGWNTLTPELINKANREQDFKKSLLETIGQEFNSGQPGHVFNKCDNFINNINIDDYVIIPGTNSDIIAFAKITSSCYVKKDTAISEAEYNAQIEAGYKDIFGDLECPYNKRRDIDILKVVEKKDLSPMIYKAITSYQSLNNIKSYGPDILSTIYPVYIYNKNIYLNFNVRKQSDIKAIDYSGFIHSATLLMSYHTGDDKIFVKSNINSPGLLTLIKSAGTEILNFLNPKLFTFLILYIVAFGGKVGPIEVNSIYDMWKNRRDKELEEMQKRANIDKTKAETQKILQEIEQTKNEDIKLNSAISTIITTAESLEIQPLDEKNQPHQHEETD